MKSSRLLLISAALLLFFSEAAAQKIDFTSYGAGPMLKPGRTFYVSLSGNDTHDGKTLKSAWRTVKRGVKELRAGDTLLIADGIYEECGISVNYGKGPRYSLQCGKPGSPIRIMGMKGAKVVIQSGKFLPYTGKKRVALFKSVREPVHGVVWETPSQVHLQAVNFPEIVHEIPGTFFYDKKKKTLLVHFVERSPQGIRVADDRVGMRIRGSYIHLENVIFKNAPTGLSVRVNAPVAKNDLHHVTVKNCGVFHTTLSGINVEGGRLGLYTGNYGRSNGKRGTIFTSPRAHDNLYTANWCGPSPDTLRHLPPYRYNYAFNFYGGRPGKRNHVISNVFDDVFAFRWKSACPESIFKNNMVLGHFRVESGPVPVEVKNNLITGILVWGGVSMNAVDANFKGTPMKFSGNIRKKELFKYTDTHLRKAESLAVPGHKYALPPVRFADLKAAFIYSDSAAVLCKTPENDGKIRVFFRKKGTTKWYISPSAQQGVRHAAGLSGLAPDTLYEFYVIFDGRRGEKSRSKTLTFRTAKTMRAPKVLEVGKGKLSLLEASCAAIPGDTVKLLPGRHIGSFTPLRSGKPGKPITLRGTGEAVIDGLYFYSPLVNLNGKNHMIVDNVRFINPECESRKSVISAIKSNWITVRNCISIHKLYAGPFFKGLGHDYDLENNVSCGGDYALSFHNSKNVRVHRNSVINSALYCLTFWGGTGNYTLTDNIYYRFSVPQKTNPAMLFIGVTGKIRSEGNIFFSPHKHQYIGGTFVTMSRKVLKASKTLSEWQQKTGLDKTSRHIDPRFINIDKGDFRLKPGSPATGKGALIK